MSFNLIYGMNPESKFYDASETIAKEFKRNFLPGITQRINNTFFCGGPLAPKSIHQLSSCNNPEQLGGLTGHVNNTTTSTI